MDVSYIPESGCCCLFIPLFFSFFFLSNFQTLKIIITLFSGTVRPRRLKLGTHVDNGWMYRVYENQAAAAYLSLYFFTFMPPQPRPDRGIERSGCLNVRTTVRPSVCRPG